MLQQTSKAVASGGTNLAWGTSLGSWRWGSHHEGALSLHMLLLLPAWIRLQDPATSWCSASGIQGVVQYRCYPSGRWVSWLKNRNIPPCVCVRLLFRVETDSVPLRALKIGYGNVFSLSHSFGSALHLLDFAFSTKRSSHCLLKITFSFPRASWTACVPDQFFKKAVHLKPQISESYSTRSSIPS